MTMTTTTELLVCRLCMNSEFLMDLFQVDGDTSLNIKTVSCINLKMFQGDGLPEKICTPCKSTIRDFYSFKKKCLEIDKKLRAIFKAQQTEQSKNYIEGNKMIIAQENSNENLVCPKYMDTDDTKIIETNNQEENMSDNYDSNFESLKCESCGEIFSIKRALEKHLLSHSGTKRFPCKICSKSFSRSESHVIHMRSHLGIKPFICEICGSSSTKKQDLIRHLRIHSEERNFSCSLCNRKFKRSSDIPSHMRTHSGIRPYRCNICNKSYTSHSGLRKHLNTCK